MSSHQRVWSPPSSQLPAFTLWSPHHPRSPRVPELPHTGAAVLTQAHHAGATDVGFTQPVEQSDRCKYASVFEKWRRNTNLVFHSSSHLPAQVSGGYSWVAGMDFPLRGLMATKEKNAVLGSFIFPSFSSSSKELRNWCCSRTNNTPCAQTRKGLISRKEWQRYRGMVFCFYCFYLHRRNILWGRLCEKNPLQRGLCTVAVQSLDSYNKQKQFNCKREQLRGKDEATAEITFLSIKNKTTVLCCFVLFKLFFLSVGGSRNKQMSL